MAVGSMVSGRVPAELRRRGDEALGRIGQTPTALIRAAYEYVVATGSLPQIAQPESKGAPRKLTGDDRKMLLESIRATTLDVPSAWFQGKSDKQLLADALEEKLGKCAL